MKESDLYVPLKLFLENQGYQVKGEVKDCDVLAVREGEPPVVIELKLSLNLDLVLQAVDRLKLTPTVYIGIPPKCAALRNKRRQVIKLIRMLGLGLISIEPNLRSGAVEVIADPGEYRPRTSNHRQRRLLGEFANLVGDPNRGGMEKRGGIMTAYRQRALALAEFLKQHGPMKAAEIASMLDEPKARDILYRNVYGWFDRVATGIYQLSPRGKREIIQWRE